MQDNDFPTRILWLLALLAAMRLAMPVLRQPAGPFASGKWIAVGDTLVALRPEKASRRAPGFPLGERTAPLERTPEDSP